MPPKAKLPRCKNGTRRNKVSGKCEPMQATSTKKNKPKLLLLPSSSSARSVNGFNILNERNLTKGLSLENIAEMLQGKILVRYSSDDLGLNGEIKLLNNANPLKEMKELIDSKIFNRTAIMESDDLKYILVEFTEGDRDAMEIFKYFNMEMSEFSEYNKYILQ